MSQLRSHARLEFALATLVALGFAAGAYFLFSNRPGYAGTIGDIPLLLFVLVAGVIGALIGSRIAVGHSRRKLSSSTDGSIESGTRDERNLGAILINWGAVAGLVGGAAAGTFELTQSQFESQLDALRDQLEIRNDELSQTEAELGEARQNFEELVIETKRVSLLTPQPGATEVGSMKSALKFDWREPEEIFERRYILEIRNISDQSMPPLVFDFLKRIDEPLHIPVNRLTAKLNSSTEFLWRIRPGQLVDGKQAALGPWSHYGYFVLYPSIFDRIQSTGVVRIGFSGSFGGVFNKRRSEGGFEGFDQDFKQWIIAQLSEELGTPLSIEHNEIRFRDLLPELREYRLDMVISSMTRTKKREEQNPGVYFTEPYLNVNQIFISSGTINRPFPQALSGAVVGVSPNSTNAKAARYLEKQFGFSVVEFEESGGSRRALREGIVEFNISDNSTLSGELGNTVFQYGPPLDQYLKGLYREEYGFSSESYGIAVRDEQLLGRLNEILTSQEAKDYLDKLKEKWLTDES